MVIAVCAVAFATFFTGCGTSIKTDVINNMADIRYNLFVGQAENVSVNLMCGMRENPYQSDGIAKKNVQFGVITATFKVHPTQIVHFALTVGSQTYAGVMEENPYNHTYMVDIEKIVSSEEGVYLTIENVAQNMQLIPESKDWTVQYGQALDPRSDPEAEYPLYPPLRRSRYCRRYRGGEIRGTPPNHRLLSDIQQ